MLVTRSQQNSSFIVRFVIAQPCIIQSCILALFLYSTDKSKCSHTVTEAADHLTHASATAAPEWVTIACFSSFTVQLTLNSMTVPRSNHWFAVLLSCGKVSKMSLDVSRKNCFEQKRNKTSAKYNGRTVSLKRGRATDHNKSEPCKRDARGRNEPNVVPLNVIQCGEKKKMEEFRPMRRRIHCVPKKEDSKLVALSLSILNRFLKCFHQQSL